MKMSVRTGILAVAGTVAIGTIGFGAAALAAGDTPVVKREETSQGWVHDTEGDDDLDDMLDDDSQTWTNNTVNTADTRASAVSNNTRDTKNTRDTRASAVSQNTRDSRDSAPSVNTAKSVVSKPSKNSAPSTPTDNT